MKRVFAILLSGLCFATGISQANGQDILNELFGHGVHAYFSGNLDAAEQFLNQAIDSGSQDPRAYYFRGLTQARRGGAGAGEADYQTGAELEATSKRSVPADVIAKSLTRIQGAQRLEIEKARSAARLAAKMQAALMRRSAPEMGGGMQGAGGGMQPAAPDRGVIGEPMQGAVEAMPSVPATQPEVVPTPSNDKATDPFKDDAPAVPQPSTDAPATQPAADPFDPFK